MLKRERFRLTAKDTLDYDAKVENPSVFSRPFTVYVFRCGGGQSTWSCSNTAPNTMRYDATIEDPQVFQRPWTVRIELALHSEPNFQLIEHECETGRARRVSEATTRSVQSSGARVPSMCGAMLRTFEEQAA